MGGSTKLMTSSGGGVILTPAGNTASDVTVNVPTQNCTLGIQGPAFRAFVPSNVTLSHNTLTKVPFTQESFDTGNCFDNASSYRFTPTVAGYYSMSSSVLFQFSSSRVYFFLCRLSKNGSAFQDFEASSPVTAPGSGETSVSGSTLVYMNGTTDYLELFAYGYDYTASSSITVAGMSNGSQTSFSASLVRAS